ncbi:Os10g0447400, partial [Oryza sativa Japonica Group]
GGWRVGRRSGGGGGGACDLGVGPSERPGRRRRRRRRHGRREVAAAATLEKGEAAGGAGAGRSCLRRRARSAHHRLLHPPLPRAHTHPPATPLTARTKDLRPWTTTAATSSLSPSRSPSAPSSSPAARLPAARLLRRPAAPRAVGGGEGDRAGVEVVADVDVLLREVPEDGHRLLLRYRHDRQAQRPFLHHHERVLRHQRQRQVRRQVRTPASSPDSPVRFTSCWLYTRGHSRSVTHTLF